MKPTRKEDQKKKISHTSSNPNAIKGEWRSYLEGSVPPEMGHSGEGEAEVKNLSGQAELFTKSCWWVKENLHVPHFIHTLFTHAITTKHKHSDILMWLCETSIWSDSIPTTVTLPPPCFLFYTRSCTEIFFSKKLVTLYLWTAHSSLCFFVDWNICFFSLLLFTPYSWVRFICIFRTKILRHWHFQFLFTTRNNDPTICNASLCFKLEGGPCGSVVFMNIYYVKTPNLLTPWPAEAAYKFLGIHVTYLKSGVFDSSLSLIKKFAT